MTLPSLDEDAAELLRALTRVSRAVSNAGSLESIMRLAAEQGCDLAMMCALPGSASQRNAERHGFRIAYTRIKWQLG